MVSHRDVIHDVGRDIAAPSEFRRSDPSAVATAACKRATEALRAIEEYGKTIDPGFAAAVEGLRYRAYDLERRIVATAQAQSRFGDIRLYVIITESFCRNDWLATAEAALRGGADCLQLREKELSDRELLDRARRLTVLCRDSGAIFIVNDRPDIALAAGAHGVHLGQDDLPVAAARRLLPAGYIVGLSTHTPEQVEAGIAEAPDYLAVGPLFDSPTKSQPTVAGPSLLAFARTRASLPLVAIGGINAETIGTVLGAASCCVCVCGAVDSQADPAAAAGVLRAAVDKARKAGVAGRSGRGRES